LPSLKRGNSISRGKGARAGKARPDSSQRPPLATWLCVALQIPRFMRQIESSPRARATLVRKANRPVDCNRWSRPPCAWTWFASSLLLLYLVLSIRRGSLYRKAPSERAGTLPATTSYSPSIYPVAGMPSARHFLPTWHRRIS
jgi:hypothetical protein